MSGDVTVIRLEPDEYHVSFVGALVEIYDYDSERTLGIVLQSGFDRIESFGLPKTMKEKLKFGHLYRIVFHPKTHKLDDYRRETWSAKRIEDIQGRTDLYDWGMFAIP